MDDIPLKAAVAAFIKDHDMSAVTFGRKAMNDPHFVRDLNAGRRLWPETEQRVRAFIDAFVPEQAAA